MSRLRWWARYLACVAAFEALLFVGALAIGYPALGYAIIGALALTTSISLNVIYRKRNTNGRYRKAPEAHRAGAGGGTGDGTRAGRGARGRAGAGMSGGGILGGGQQPNYFLRQAQEEAIRQLLASGKTTIGRVTTPAPKPKARPAGDFDGREREFAAGVVTGSRSFDVDKLGRLVGVAFATVWLPGENLARCMERPDPMQYFTGRQTWRLREAERPPHSLAECELPGGAAVRFVRCDGRRVPARRRRRGAEPRQRSRLLDSGGLIMPTGYTAPLHDGQPITFEQFVLRCSRAMGAAIMQRDESIDVKIRLREVSDYSIRAVEKSGAALTEAWGRSDEAWAELQEAAIADAEKYRAEYLEKRDGIQERYEDMLARVQGWQPPTAEHQGLKDFMVQQLEESLSWDVGSYTPSVPDELPVAEYRERELGRLARALERDTKSLQEERDRVRSQNAWVTALRDSLGIAATEVAR